MKRIQPELIPLLLAAFLAPVIGGHVSLDAMPLQGPYLASLFGAPESPFGTRALIGTLIVLSLGLALARRRVVQIPHLALCGLVFGLVALTGLSILSSAFPYTSYSAWPTWIVYGLAALAVVATSGRKAGVKALAWAMVLGGTITALKGVREYSEYRAIEPGHRVFADWNNPNAVAGVLCVLVPVAIGLCLGAERLEALGAGTCAALMLFALALTQSKGGLLSSAVSLVTLTALAGIWKARGRLARAGIPVAVAALITFGAATANRNTDNGTAFARVVNAASTQEQSAGFRTLLWKGSVEMAKSNPKGFGLATFRYESGRPGLTEQTFHAHQTWLQLAVEASPLATLTLVAIAFLWLAHVMRGARTWPWPEAGFRAGLVGACVAAAANGMVESNLVYLGTGVTVFLVLGLGLQLSSDGVLPEYTPRTIRWALVVVTCLVPLALLWHTAAVESMKSGGLARADSGDSQGARSLFESALRLAPADGDSHYLLSGFATSGEERAKILAKASTLTPSTKYLRAYARAAAELDWAADVEGALERALARDPHNLQALAQLYQWYDTQGRPAKALETARRLVEVEKSTVFQIRAIPEIVPLETFEARLFVAGRTGDSAVQAGLLKPALEGFGRYLEHTAPLVKRMTNGDPARSFLGHDMAEVQHVKDSVTSVASDLKGVYRSLGDETSASWVDEFVSKLPEG